MRQNYKYIIIKISGAYKVPYYSPPSSRGGGVIYQTFKNLGKKQIYLECCEGSFSFLLVVVGSSLVTQDNNNLNIF